LSPAAARDTFAGVEGVPLLEVWGLVLVPCFGLADPRLVVGVLVLSVVGMVSSPARRSFGLGVAAVGQVNTPPRFLA
jgi:hypothetical protein